MAGLGETCSHVASLLWAIAAGAERRESLTVTQKSAYWVMLPAIKKVPYVLIAEITFTGKKRRSSCTKGNSDHNACAALSRSIASPNKQSRACVPSDEEKIHVALYESLSTCSGAKPVVLAIVPPFSDAYVPSSVAEDLPTMLSDLYQNDRLRMGYNCLLQVAKDTEISITPEQVKTVEVKTRHQAARVTAMVSDVGGKDHCFKIQKHMLY